MTKVLDLDMMEELTYQNGKVYRSGRELLPLGGKSGECTSPLYSFNGEVKFSYDELVLWKLGIHRPSPEHFARRIGSTLGWYSRKDLLDMGFKPVFNMLVRGETVLGSRLFPMKGQMKGTHGPYYPYVDNAGKNRSISLKKILKLVEVSQWKLD